MIHGKNILLALILSVCACDGSSALMATEDARLEPTGSPVAQLEPAETRRACPSQDFDQFLQAFAANVDVQRAHTANSLLSESLDVTAEPEPRLVSRQLDRVDLRFPLMPSSQQQLDDGLKVSLTKLGGQVVEVTLRKPDTDYQVSFFFRKGDCWELYRKRDDSM